MSQIVTSVSTSEGRRPLVAIPSRFSASASALRFDAEVSARRLVQAVYDAGGEPVMLHPHAPGGRVSDEEVAARLWFADAVLLPGGGDVAAEWYGAEPHASAYDVDLEQDAFDLAVARAALRRGLPLLAICRGNQVVNVALGGDLVQDMDESGGNHRQVVQQIAVEAGTHLASLVGSGPTISCFHHQCVGRLGDGLRAVARSVDGVVEAVELTSHDGWYVGVQWHPEDTAESDRGQAAIFRGLVEAARARVPS